MREAICIGPLPFLRIYRRGNPLQRGLPYLRLFIKGEYRGISGTGAGSPGNPGRGFTVLGLHPDRRRLFGRACGSFFYIRPVKPVVRTDLKGLLIYLLIYCRIKMFRDPVWIFEFRFVFL